MTIAIGGQIFADEWEHALSQFNQNPVEQEKTPIMEPRKPIIGLGGAIRDLPQENALDTPSVELKARTPGDIKEASFFDDWVSKAVTDIGHGIGLFGRAAEGESMDPRENPEVIKGMMDVGGAVVLGPMPVARKIVDGTLGSIAGVSANKSISDEIRLVTAKIMDSRRVDPDKIWEKTGWFKGTDNQWRFEIDPSGAKLNLPEKFTTKSDIPGDVVKKYTSLEKVLDFPGLYKAYPQLKKIEVRVDPKTNYVAYFRNQHLDEPSILALGKDFLKMSPAEQRGVILHEVQHGIQHLEPGFFKGRGGPDYQAEEIFYAAKEVSESLKKQGKEKEATEFLRTVNSLVKDVKASKKREVGEEFYFRDPAEIEARTADVRSRWTPEQRSWERPSATSERDAEGSPLIFPRPTIGVPKE